MGDVAKAFNRLQAEMTNASGDGADDERQKRAQRAQEAEALLARDVAPTSTEACIPWILDAWKQRNYFKCAHMGLTAYLLNVRPGCQRCFTGSLRHSLANNLDPDAQGSKRTGRNAVPASCRLLGLPPVEVDALGRPTWECTAADVSRAYRKLSALVHPDKAATAAHPDGRAAFEALNEAARILKDPARREDEVGKRVAQARRRRALQDAAGAGGIEARVAANAARGAQAAQLRQARRRLRVACCKPTWLHAQDLAALILFVQHML
jgi:DnaJ domain